MTNFGAGYKIESKESRALASITADSYDYRDQAKLLSKLTGDVEYLAQYSRQMQKGIDAANQNFIQQIGDFINEIITVIGGGGNTGFDFGDLRYVLQAIGSLFGFDEATGIASVLPINLFSAAWHFFSTYILPIDNFGEWADNFIDQIFATLLDIFGEIPLLGQALQQFAVWITGIRDLVSAFNDLIGSWTVPFVEWLEETVAWLDTTVGGWLSETVTWISETFFGWTEPIATWIWDSVSWLATILAGWTQPVVDTIVDAVNWVLEIFSGWTESLTTWITNSLTGLTTVFGDWSVAIADWVRNTLDWLETTFTTWTEPIATWVTSSVTWLTETFAAWTAPIATWITDSVTWLTEAFAAWTEPIATWVNSSVDWLMGLFDGGLGTLAQSMVTGLTDSFANVNNWVQDVIDAVIGALTGIPIIGGAIQGIVNGFQSLFNGLFGQPAPSTVLAATAVPGLDGTKITTGSVAAERIAALDAAKITTGQLAEARIADMNAAKITSGTFGNDRIADGAINNVKISDIAGEKVTAGSVAAARIAALDASKITTGQIVNDRIATLQQNKVNGLITSLKTKNNLVSNPGFENPIFYMGNATYSTEVVRSGYYSAKIVGTGLGQWTWLNTTDSSTILTSAKAGDVVYMECWIYGSPSNTINSSGFYLYAQGLDGTGAINYENLNAGGIGAGTALNGVWTKFSGYRKIVHEDVRQLTLGIYTTCAAGEVYYLDDAVVRFVTDANEINQALYASNYTASTVVANAVPSLDGSKITTGSVAEDRIAALSQNKITNLVSDLNVALTPVGDNMVRNSGFENSNFYIQTFSGSVGYSTLRKRSGTQSLRVTGGHRYPYLFTNYTTTVKQSCKAGDVFYCEIWVYGDDANSDTNTSMWIGIEIYDLTGAAISPSLIAGPTIGGQNWYPAGNAMTGVWTKMSGYVQMPSNAAFFQWVLQSYAPNAPSNVYYFDDPFLCRVTETNLINQALYGTNTVAPASTIIANSVPALDASKVTTGSFPQSQVTNLSTDLTTIDGKAVVAQNALSSAIQTGGNLASDPGFENTDYKTRYNTANNAYSTEYKRSGSRSMKLIGQTGVNVDIDFFRSTTQGYLTIPIQENDVWYFEAWIRGGTGNTKTAGAIRPYVMTGDPLSPTWVYPTNVAVYSGTLEALNSSWQKLSGYFVAPADSFALQMVVQLHTSAGTGCILHVDDLVCYRITEANQISQALYNANTPSSTILANSVPELDGTKITTGSVAEDRIANLSQNKITGLTTDISKFNTITNVGNNLVADPDFENTLLDTTRLSFLSGNTWSYDTSQKYTGTRSLKCVSNGTYAQFYATSNMVTGTGGYMKVKPGQVFYCSFWVYADPANTGNGLIQHYLERKSATLGIAYTIISGRYYNTAQLKGVWIQESAYITIPDDGRDLIRWYSCGVRVGNNSGDTFWFDNLEMYDVTEIFNTNQALYNAPTPSSTILANSVPELDGTKITTGSVAADRIADLAQSQIIDLTDDLGTAQSTADTAKSLTENKIASGQNIVTNPDFENSLLVGTNVVRSTENPRTGTYCVKCTIPNPSYYGFIYPVTNGTTHYEVSVKPGDVFYFETWVYGDAANTTSAYNLWFQATVKRVGLANTNVVCASIVADTTNGAWTLQSGYLTAPPEAYSLQFYWVANLNLPSGNVYYIDNMKLYRVTEAVNANKVIFDTATADPTGLYIYPYSIPPLDASKISSGLFGSSLIPSLDAGKITTGAFGTARIPNLPGSIINSGSVAANYIASLDATKITTGTFGTTQIPSLDSGKITTGTLGTARIPNLPGSIINSGTVGSTYIAALDATKITTGTFGTTQIPSLDSGKITTGTLGTARIPNLPGSIINSGSVASNYIAALDASKITTGTFSNVYIASGLDATKLTIGTLPTARIGSGAITNTYLGSDINGGKITAGTVLSNYIAALDASKITTGEFAQSRIVNLESDFGDTWDSVVSGLQRVTSSGNTTADVEAITNAIAQSLQNNSSAIAAMQSESSGGAATGISATVEFSNYPNATTLAAPGFTQTYSGTGSGTWRVIDGKAAWLDGTNASRSCVARYNVAATETDYQIVIIIAGGAQEKNGTTYSANYAYGRMNSTGTTYIYAKVSGNTITLGYVVSGSNTVWGTYTSSYVSILFGAGFPVYLHCGTQGGERIYEVKFGTTTVISHTEVGTSSGLGASYRYTGMGIDQIYSGSQLAPSPISAFLMQDNPPINYLGSGFRASRNTASSPASFATGYQLFPNSFLDTVTYSTDDYTWTPATNCKVTVGVSGWYQINVGIGMPINTMMTELAPTFYKNGSVFSRGVSVWGTTSVVNRAPSSCQSSFNVYLQAGDYVQPGYWMTTAYSASGTMNGDTSGLTTYFEVTLVNRSFN